MVVYNEGQFHSITKCNACICMSETETSECPDMEIDMSGFKIFTDTFCVTLSQRILTSFENGMHPLACFWSLLFIKYPYHIFTLAPATSSLQFWTKPPPHSTCPPCVSPIYVAQPHFVLLKYPPCIFHLINL